MYSLPLTPLLVRPPELDAPVKVELAVAVGAAGDAGRVSASLFSRMGWLAQVALRGSSSLGGQRRGQRQPAAGREHVERARRRGLRGERALRSSLAARALTPADSTASLAAEDFERLIELVLEAAPKEFLMRKLGHELSRATRLVNTLEQRVAVTLTSDLSNIRRTLEEREREEHLRLKRLIARRRTKPVTSEE